MAYPLNHKYTTGFAIVRELEQFTDIVVTQENADELSKQTSPPTAKWYEFVFFGFKLLFNQIFRK